MRHRLIKPLYFGFRGTIILFTLVYNTTIYPNFAVKTDLRRLLDPAIGQAAGFGGVILHGLSTFGFAARGLLKTVCGNKPEALKLFGVRFTSPVKPGDALETQIWEVGPGPNGTTEVTFVTKNLRTGKVRSSSGWDSIQFMTNDLLLERSGGWYCVYCEITIRKVVVTHLSNVKICVCKYRKYHSVHSVLPRISQ